MEIRNRVFAWDRIQKRGKNDMSICYLCREAKEYNIHLMFHYPYARTLWKDAEKMNSYITNVWNASFIEELLRKQLSKKKLQSYRALRCLVT